MKCKTKTDLILHCIGGESENFCNFCGIVPRVGEVVTFYRKIHDGCMYKGLVIRVEHRIEYATQNDKKKDILQDVIVYLDHEQLPEELEI
jgi:hypothetical protein